MQQPAGVCPKHMVYGPCGGVRDDGGCEVDRRPCPFVAADPVRWPGRADAGPTSPAGSPGGGSGPLLLADIRPAEATLASARWIAAAYAEWADAVLVGDHHGRVELSGTVLAREFIDHGLRPWVTLSCRDRNAVALETDLVALRELGVQMAHCVTGDARATHVRPGSEPVFELDSLRLVALASSLGLTASVAESPVAPPDRHRATRAVDKHAAGAAWCLVNIGVPEPRLREFVAEVHDGAPLWAAWCASRCSPTRRRRPDWPASRACTSTRRWSRRSTAQRTRPRPRSTPRWPRPAGRWRSPASPG